MSKLDLYIIKAKLDLYYKIPCNIYVYCTRLAHLLVKHNTPHCTTLFTLIRYRVFASVSNKNYSCVSNDDVQSDKDGNS